MRRYAVRFLVAVLTFGIGVALSLFLGLFKPQDINIAYKWSSRPPCPKKFRLDRAALLSVDSQPADPLKFIHLGTAPIPHYGGDDRMLFAVENRSDKVVSEYQISGDEIWKTNERSGTRSLDWDFPARLEPGESQTITLPRNSEGLSLRVAKVNFQDGSVWVNPRQSR